MDRNALTKRILIGMASGFVLGSLLHLLALADDSIITLYLVDGLFDIGGKIFIASLKLLVVPLVFVSLVCGASNLGDGSSMGRLGGKTIVLYLFTTGIAITLALVVAILVEPGVGIDLAEQSSFVARESPSLKQVVIDIFPTNPFKAMTEGKMLQVIIFAILVGVAISKSGEHGSRMRAFLLDWNEIIMQLVLMLMAVAPYGVFCLMLTLFTHQGYEVIGDLAKYFFTVVFVLLLHFTGTFSLLLQFLARLNPFNFYRKMSPVMVYAFSTSSSNATMPVTLETVEHRLGVKNEIASFTVPLGATINMDGTAIMQGVATVFISQAYNIDIGVVGYLTVIGTATLASIGTAGVPGVGLITLAISRQKSSPPATELAFYNRCPHLVHQIQIKVNIVNCRQPQP